MNEIFLAYDPEEECPPEERDFLELFSENIFMKYNISTASREKTTRNL